jgi:hypothetical protein
MVAMAAMLCGCGEKPSTIDDLTSTEVTFPNGQKIRAEAMRQQSDLIRGMMFRESLPQDRGMLFFHMREVPTPYYTFQNKFPLDIVWMDHDHRIVEIARNVPPCPSTKAQDCPTYGGKFASLFVLEVNAGFAANHGLREGDRLEF